MGGSMRRQMVARIAIIVACGLMSAQTASSQAAGGMQIPDSLSRALSGSFAQSSGGSGGSSQTGSAPLSPALQGETAGSGASTQRATTRTGGPNTEPANTRDSYWLKGTAANNQARPSTAPYGTAGATPPASSGGGAPSAALSNNLRSSMTGAGGQPAGPAPTSAAPTSAAPTSAGGATGSGFGALPKGVNLPQNTAAQPPATNPFAKPPAGAAPTGANSAAFDPSLFNTNPYTRPGTGAATNNTAAGQTAAVPGGLGMPASHSASQNPTTTWTQQQIASLAAKFNIPATDPRLQNEAFVNDLYHQWNDYQIKLAAASGTAAPGAAAPGSAGRSVSPNAANAHSASAAGPPWGGSNPGGHPTQPRMGTDSQGNLKIQPTHRPAAAPSTGPAGAGHFTGHQPPKPLYDSFGNRVDVNGNILGNDGRPVDAATAYELTVGRKLKEDMERISRQQAELDRKRRESSSASDLVASRGPNGSGFSFGGRGELGATPGGKLPVTTKVQRPPSLEGKSASGDGGRTSVDQAGIGGAANAIGRSNPYVNVFLLSSLVANVFLFIWLHRLWNHHRELIAATRMAASGISASDSADRGL